MLTILCRYYLLRWDCDPDMKGLKDNKDLKIAVLKSDLYKVTNFALSLSIYIHTYMHIYVYSSDHYDSGLWCRPPPWLWKFPNTPLSSMPPHVWPLAIIIKPSVSIVITFLGFHINRMVQHIFFCLISFTYHLTFTIQLYCCLFQ